MASDLLEQVVAGAGPNLMPLTVEQYHRMAEAGILHDGEPVELIDGFLVWKDRRDSGRPDMNHGPAHAVAVKKLYRLIDRGLDGTDFHAQCQLPVSVPPHHEPEPDVSIIVGRMDDYSGRLPTASETAAVMEVADSSLRLDRTTKQRIYADAGIPVYWVIDLTADRIEVYTIPSVGRGLYDSRQVIAADQVVHLVLTDGISLTVPAAEILP